MKRNDNRPKNVPRRYPYGVTKRPKRETFIVKFRRDKRDIYVGSYIALEDASIAADNYARNVLHVVL